MLMIKRNNNKTNPLNFASLKVLWSLILPFSKTKFTLSLYLWMITFLKD